MPDGRVRFSGRAPYNVGRMLRDTVSMLEAGEATVVALLRFRVLGEFSPCLRCPMKTQTRLVFMWRI